MKKLKDIAYDAEYLKVLSDFKSKSKFIRNSLAREKLKQLSKKSLDNILKKCDERLYQKVKYKDQLTLTIAIDEILYGKGKFSKRLKEASEILECDDWTLSALLFYTAPRFFYLPTKALSEFAKNQFNIDCQQLTYMQFNTMLTKMIKSSDLKDYYKEPIEFTAAVETLSDGKGRLAGNTLVDSQDTKMIDEILIEIKKLDMYRLREIEIRWMQEFFKTLDDNQKMTLIDTLRRNTIHPYLRRIITLGYDKGVVIDGSNIIHSGLIQPDPNRLKELMNVLGINETIYFPIIFVFDANADFIIKKQRHFWEKHFLKNHNVYFHSPADEKILEIAYTKKYHIISNDKYRDYNPDNATIFQFRPDRGEFYLRKI